MIDKGMREMFHKNKNNKTQGKDGHTKEFFETFQFEIKIPKKTSTAIFQM